MPNDKTDITVREADGNRLEAYVDGQVAGIVEYIPAQRLIAFVHTEVEPRFEGRGVGSALARAALEMVKASDARFLPRVPLHRGLEREAPGVRPLALSGDQPRHGLTARPAFRGYNSPGTA
ncbi:GNAT family N-acetyltransferase [Actinomadura sp. NPDC049753]|uniref:GNAT family N-acetyltransferase n=1 Tax=Actinomadura sp. NPDC049753 TaxID=3154739 RepID=UPI00342C5759